MQSFDEVALREAPQIVAVTPEQLLDVRTAVRSDLFHGRDAWPAVTWLAATSDVTAKEHLIGELTAVIEGASSTLLDVDGAVDNFGSEIVFGRAAQERRRISRAFDYVTALQRSLGRNVDMPASGEGAALDLGFEDAIDERRERATRHDERQDALSRSGLQPGRGVPFFELYMRRRRKKSWG